MSSERSWSFITSHAAVLLEVHRNPETTVRELAAAAGLTERQTHRVLDDLIQDEYVIRERVGRRNRYHVNHSRPMRHRTVVHHGIQNLLDALGPR